MQRRWRITAIVAVLSITGSCAEVLEPGSDPAGLDQTSLAVAITSLSVEGDVELSLRVSAIVDIGGIGPEGAKLRSLEYGSLSDADRSALMSDLIRFQWRNPASNPLAGHPATHHANEPLPSHTRRSVSSTDSDGNRIRLVTIRPPDSRGTSTTVAASILFRNDSIQYIFETMRERGKPGISGVRALRFGQEQKPAGVTIIRVEDASSLGAADAIEAVLSQLATAVGVLTTSLSPAPLQAQEAECVEYEVEMMFAAAAFTLAELAAIAACPSTGPGCAIALAALSVAAAYLVFKTTQYQNCLYEYYNQGQDPLPPLMGGIVEPVEECWTIIWYISNDGGETWQFWGVEVIC